ncbi:MAG: hypothetical protein DRH26_15860 [Deltaproteobacteria bacterium]|nr:MAG: hypothetical protein DRH26_15860 [Deltaproteobacteria bacterium]
MSDGTATLYVDRTNPFTLTFTKNGVNLTEDEMDAITKFELRYKSLTESVGLYYDSENYPDAFVVDAGNAKVLIKPILFEWGASTKNGDIVEVLVYDAADNVGGLLWTQITLIVKSDANIPA